ncbi:hypothetical protein [Methylobacterium dankookense]|uniref:Uncharacterized protein n=1 Tax=Methylobacterium dankookense TaxID=560405 RepID=A0A564FU68_9HYPH|nr:hypothetical protein [Methylobacterium dankookense]GJD55352.1 hypothetical protein IFDJLNFL_1237 [Methylobacterium dankookense]VUF11220.1 hypothetical protein MTDSW087_00896 [Methylobacterium dankookense]
MTQDSRQRPSLKEFDAYADRNGQDMGQDSARDVGIPARTQADLKSDPQGQAETARLASGTPRQDATDATEAETPPENLRRLRGESDGAAAEAIECATAAIGQDDEKR